MYSAHDSTKAPLPADAIVHSWQTRQRVEDPQAHLYTQHEAYIKGKIALILFVRCLHLRKPAGLFFAN